MSEIVEVEKWIPDYEHNCEVCGQTPVVCGVNKRGNVVYHGTMCGVCTWGEAICLDPEEWNKPIEEN
jgi:hypothetical protein